MWEDIIRKQSQQLDSKQLVTTNIKRVPKPEEKDGPCKEWLKKLIVLFKKLDKYDTVQVTERLDSVSEKTACEIKKWIQDWFWRPFRQNQGIVIPKWNSLVINIDSDMFFGVQSPPISNTIQAGEVYDIFADIDYYDIFDIVNNSKQGLYNFQEVLINIDKHVLEGNFATSKDNMYKTIGLSWNRWIEQISEDWKWTTISKEQYLFPKDTLI